MKIKMLRDVITAKYGRLMMGQELIVPEADAKDLIRLGDAAEVSAPKAAPQKAARPRASKPRSSKPKAATRSKRKVEK